MDLLKLLKTKGAKSVLDQVDEVEKAVALTGKERDAYLQALDRVYGEKSQRIADMGFESTPYYHGTTFKGPISEFRESGTKKGDIAKYGQGVYVTSSPNYASQYAGFDEGQVLPLRIKQQKTFNPADLDQAKEILKELGYDKAIQTSKLRSSEEGMNLLEKTLGKKDWSSAIQKAGYRVSLPDDLIDVTAKNNVRSEFAAFDPRFAKSGNLLAGAGAIPVATQVNPLNALSSLVEKYRQAQEQAANVITETVSKPFGQPDEMQKAIGQIVFDPLNAVPGVAGAGLSVIDLITPRKK